MLCLGGKIRDYLESARIWEQDRISYFTSTPEYRELDNLSGRTLCVRVEDFLKAHDKGAAPGDPDSQRIFEGRIIFMCQSMPKSFPRVIGHSSVSAALKSKGAEPESAELLFSAQYMPSISSVSADQLHTGVRNSRCRRQVQVLISNLSWFSATSFRTSQSTKQVILQLGAARREIGMTLSQNLPRDSKISHRVRGCRVREDSLKRTVLHDRP